MAAAASSEPLATPDAAASPRKVIRIVNLLLGSRGFTTLIHLMTLMNGTHGLTRQKQ